MPLTTPKRPRIFYGWYLVGACMAIHFYFSASFVYGFQAFFNPIAREFGWSRTLMTGAFSMQRLEGGIIAPLAGFLVDRFGSQKMIIGGMLVAGCGMLLLSQIRAPWHYYLAMLIISLGTSGGMGVSFAAAAVNWFVRKRGRAMSVLWLGAVPSGFLVPGVVWLVQNFGWRTSMVILGLGIWAIGIPAGVMIRYRPEPYGYLPDGDDPAKIVPDPSSTVTAQRPAPEQAVDTRTGFTAVQALKTPAFWLITVIFGIHQMGPSSVFIIQIPYLESIGFSTERAAWTVGVFTLLSGIGRFGGGTAMDFLDKRLVLIMLLLCQVVGLFVLINISSFWMIFLYALLFGVSFGGMIPARPIILSEYYGTKHFGAIQGLEQGMSIFGGIIGPVLVGRLFDITHSYKPGLGIVAALTALVIPVAPFLRTPARLAEIESQSPR